MASRWSTDRLAEEIAILGGRGLSRSEYFAELAPRLRRVVDSDASCWHTLDPQTGLLTSDEPTELIESGVFSPEAAPGAGELIVRSEYLVDDRNTFAQLAARRLPVGTLEQATRGDLRSSPRYRHLLEPAGIPHELRAVFLIRGRAWGAVHVARRAGGEPFTQADVGALAAVATPIAKGIRGSLRFEAARRQSGAEAPGLVVLDAAGEVEMITPAARELTAALGAESASYGEEQLPAAVLSLAAFARHDADPGGKVVTIPSGQGWLTLHATSPEARDGRVAIVIESASGPRSATVRLEAHGATAREREVATLIARGLTNPEIATALVLSPHTVQDHVKSLFEKLGVGSRQELVARVFLDEYLPEVVNRTPLTSYGRFEVE